MSNLAFVLKSVGAPIGNSILSSVSLSLIQTMELTYRKKMLKRYKKKYTISMARNMTHQSPFPQIGARARDKIWRKRGNPEWSGKLME